MNLKLKIRLFEVGMTQKQLAEAVGVQQSTISLIVQGRTRPTVDVAIAIARKVGMSVEEIWGGKETE